MKIKDRYNEFKAKHNLTDFDVVANGMVIGIIATTLGAIAWGIKEAIEDEANQDAWAKEQYEAGRHVYQLSNGSLISTDKIYVY